MPENDCKTIPNTVVVIICGTFVAQWYADRVYGPLADVYRRRGYEVSVMAIPGLGLGPMDEALEEMALSLTAEYTDPETRFILVGHSQGGSHVVGLLKRLKGRVITPIFPLSAPHHGTRLANLGTPVHFLPKSFREMAAHSNVLHRLRQAEETIEDIGEAEIISIMSCFDQLVLPFFASILSGADNVVLAPSSLHPLFKRLGFRRSKGVELVHGYAGHLGIIKHPEILRRLEEQLDLLEDRLQG